MFWSLSTTGLDLRSKSKPRIQGPAAQSSTKTEDSPQEEEGWVLCRQCRHRISRPSESIAVNGAHQHTFANPSGIVFEIVCYRNATGCASSGSPSTDFTWFAGHSWQIVICARCLTHLGWRFASNQGTHFFGLIVDHIETGTS